MRSGRDLLVLLRLKIRDLRTRFVTPAEIRGLLVTDCQYYSVVAVRIVCSIMPRLVRIFRVIRLHQIVSWQIWASDLVRHFSTSRLIILIQVCHLSSLIKIVHCMWHQVLTIYMNEILQASLSKAGAWWCDLAETSESASTQSLSKSNICIAATLW